MNALIAFVLAHRRSVVALWAACVLAAAPLALRLPSVIQGCSEAIRDSEAELVNRALQREFGRGSAYAAMVVVTSEHAGTGDPRFAAAVRTLAAGLAAKADLRSVTHAWNLPNEALLGNDGRSALLLVQPGVDSLGEAEGFTQAIRARIGDTPLPAGFAAKLTGPAAMFHDINRNSSADLLRAEMVGVPLTLVILLAVFGSPLVAGLALALAFAAVTLAAAGLYLLSPWMPVTVFAQNVVTIIGLGAGVDYCLFVLYRYRSALRQGLPPLEALLSAWRGAGPAVIVAGLTVAAGFLALFLANARILHSLALGGLMVALAAVAAALTLLPALLHCLGDRLGWHSDAARGSAAGRALRAWGERLAHRVTLRPWLHLIASLALVAILAAPSLRMNSWSVGVTDLPRGFEAREGYELLDRQFEKGWMGPVVLVFEPGAQGDLQQDKARRAVAATAAQLQREGRVAQIHADAAGRIAVLNLITRHPPESPEMMQFVRELRARDWREATAAGITVKVGGTSALLLDFDAEMSDSLWRVIPAVLAISFLALLAFFRSVLIPLKAVAVNLLSVLAAYGFLVSVFQDGAAAAAGLNSFVVLMLFTILFGLSMDYEIVLLRQIQEHYRATGDNAAAVVSGLGQSAGVISSAAAVMACLFASLAFAQLAATRQFGLGMAFAVALDASLIRLIVIPAMMVLLGRANWWYPGRAPIAARAPAPDVLRTRTARTGAPGRPCRERGGSA